MSPRLSDAQKRALLGIPVKRAFKPCHTGFQWPTLSRLKALRLINSVCDGVAGLGPYAMHVITPTGRRVREELSRVLTPPEDASPGDDPHAIAGGSLYHSFHGPIPNQKGQRDNV